MPKSKSSNDQKLVILDNPDDTDSLRRREKAHEERPSGRKRDRGSRR